MTRWPLVDSFPELKDKSKEVSQFAGRLMKEASKFVDTDTRDLEETGTLKAANQFLASEFECEISVYSADDTEIYDPQGKRGAAFPRKPAIFIE